MEAVALIERLGTTTTDASLALGTLRTQAFLEIETDIFHLENVFNFSWAAEKIFELPRLGFLDDLLAAFATALESAGLTA